MSNKNIYKEPILIKFHNENLYSITLHILSQDKLTGSIEITNSFDTLSYKFEGLVYQVNKNMYHFTFHIDWPDYNTPSYTVFTGYLNLKQNIMNSELEISWLCVQQGVEESINSNGTSKLTTTPSTNSPEGLLPYPTIKRMNVLHET